jgi:hypothetical protein
MAAAATLTVDELVALGVARAKAEQTLKNKSMSALIASIIAKVGVGDDVQILLLDGARDLIFLLQANALTGANVGQDRGRALFELSQKLKPNVSAENRE